MSIVLRRLLIVVASLAVIAGIVTTVRTAATLRADAAPLVVAPVSPQQVSADLAAPAVLSARVHGTRLPTSHHCDACPASVPGAPSSRL